MYNSLKSKGLLYATPFVVALHMQESVGDEAGLICVRKKKLIKNIGFLFFFWRVCIKIEVMDLRD